MVSLTLTLSLGSKINKNSIYLSTLSNPFVRSCAFLASAFEDEESFEADSDYKALEEFVNVSMRTLVTPVQPIADALVAIKTLKNNEFSPLNTFTVEVMGEVKAQIQLTTTDLNIAFPNYGCLGADIRTLNYTDLQVVVKAMFALANNRTLADEKLGKLLKFNFNDTIYDSLFLALLAVNPDIKEVIPGIMFFDGACSYEELLGKRLVYITGAELLSDYVIMYDSTGQRYFIYDCPALMDCVEILTMEGTADNIINQVITAVEVEVKDVGDDSHTHVTINTNNGSLKLNWLASQAYEHDEDVSRKVTFGRF